MITVEFLGPIGKAPITMEASNLKDVSIELKDDKSLAEWLDNCAVAVNDTMVDTLEFSLKDGDRVSILPPVCGG